MAERWLYGVDGGLQGSLPPWESDLWDDGIDPPSSDLGSLTEIVIIDGQVIDSRRRPVSGSGYECAALELDHQRGRPPQPRVERVVVREPVHERMIHWLERVVGGERALTELDAAPLPAAERLDVAALAAGDVDRALVIDEHLDLAGPPPILAGELLTAYRRLLVESARTGLLRHWRDVPPHKVAATIIHCVIKANGLTGARAPFRVMDFISGLDLQQAPYDRSRGLALLVGGRDWPHGLRPDEVPEVFVLGSVELLVSRFRNELLTYRDLALRAECTSGTSTEEAAG